MTREERPDESGREPFAVRAVAREGELHTVFPVRLEVRVLRRSWWYGFGFLRAADAQKRDVFVPAHRASQVWSPDWVVIESATVLEVHELDRWVRANGWAWLERQPKLF